MICRSCEELYLTWIREHVNSGICCSCHCRDSPTVIDIKSNGRTGPFSNLYYMFSFWFYGSHHKWILICNHHQCSPYRYRLLMELNERGVSRSRSPCAQWCMVSYCTPADLCHILSVITNSQRCSLVSGNLVHCRDNWNLLWVWEEKSLLISSVRQTCREVQTIITQTVIIK